MKEKKQENTMTVEQTVSADAKTVTIVMVGTIPLSVAHITEAMITYLREITKPENTRTLGEAKAEAAV